MIIPSVQRERKIDGSFLVNPFTQIVISSTDSKDMHSAKVIQNEIYSLLGFKLPITRGKVANNNCINIISSKLTLDLNNGNLNGNIDKINCESYELNITESLINVTATTATGRFYGIQSLRQLLRVEGAEIICREIVDYPQFSERGFYHDVTRGKVPSLETLKTLVDRASLYKINELQLYVEHSFAFKNHTELWCGNDPLTAEEILELDQYCRANHVELVPSLSTFGHLYHALKSHSFNHLCELDDSLDTRFSWMHRMSHHTLDVSSAESIDFVRDILEEFIPLFSSKKFNICCDETFDLCKGKNIELANKIGSGRIYVDFLNKIIDIVKKHDKTPMFWGDIILKYPELLKEIPQDVMCLNWNYSSEATENSTRTIGESGLPQYVCPGTSGWDNFINNIEGGYLNISKMASYGVKHKAIGLLNTDWGDYGHINLIGTSIPGLIYGATASWNGTNIESFDNLNKKISLIEFRDKSEGIVNILSEMHKCQGVSHLEIVWWREAKEGTNDIFASRPELKEKYINNIPEDKLTNGYLKSLELEKELLKITASVPCNIKVDCMEFYISNKLIQLTNALFLVIKKYDLKETVTKLIYEPKELAVELERVLDMYCDVWRNRNKESELSRIKDHYVFICKFLRTL